MSNTPACAKVYTVVSGDYSPEIETANGISDAQLYALNPWLDSSCGKLYAKCFRIECSLLLEQIYKSVKTSAWDEYIVSQSLCVVRSCLSHSAFMQLFLRATTRKCGV